MDGMPVPSLNWLLAMSLLTGTLTCAVAPLMRKLAVRNGLVDHPNYRKKHGSPTPACAGLAAGINSAAVSLPARRSAMFTTLFSPFLPFSIALLDVGLAVVRRRVRGRKIYLPDTDHLHHRLATEFGSPVRVNHVVSLFYSPANKDRIFRQNSNDFDAHKSFLVSSDPCQSLLLTATCEHSSDCGSGQPHDSGFLLPQSSRESENAENHLYLPHFTTRLFVHDSDNLDTRTSLRPGGGM